MDSALPIRVAARLDMYRHGRTFVTDCLDHFPGQVSRSALTGPSGGHLGEWIYSGFVPNSGFSLNGLPIASAW